MFNGSRFRAEIAPRIADFVLSNNRQFGNAGNRPVQLRNRAAYRPDPELVDSTMEATEYPEEVTKAHSAAGFC